MRTEDLLDAIGNVDDELLERSERIIIKKQSAWKKWLPMAACVCLVMGLGIFSLRNGLKMESANDSASADMECGTEDDSATESVTDNYAYVCYVYPLATEEMNEHITAVRQVDLGESQAEDKYILTNSSDEVQRMTAYYPAENVAVYINGESTSYEEVEMTIGDFQGFMYKLELEIPVNGEVEIAAVTTYLMNVNHVSVLTELNENLTFTETRVTLPSEQEFFLEPGDGYCEFGLDE